MLSQEKIAIQCKDIISELHLEYLSEAEQEDLITEMSEVVYEKIILRLIDKLTPDDVISLSNLLDLEKYDEAGNFLSEKVKNFETIIDEEITEFQDELIKFSK
jgi:Mg/Co/Ni transporter MgtE